MNKIIRQDKILEILDKQNSVNLEDLSEELNVSMVTLRRDIAELTEKGLIEKFYGGIRKKNQFSEAQFFERVKINQRKKEKIADLALNFISKGDTIYLDASSTCYVLAKKLIEKVDFLNVVTNNLYTAIVLSKNITYNITVVGGTLDNKNCVIVGVYPENMMKEIRVEKAFFSCSAFSIEEGAFENLPQSGTIKNIVAKNTNQIYLLVDSSKIGKKSIMKTLEPHEINKFISDEYNEELYKIFKKDFIY
ncbi:DeoR/GlpR family DNA-binding transcription regulator [Petrotoga sp. 9PWA.NaAc.5.4]|uniref:DeoR/GlpR family DNA-binding transcription regulator n=1 Tax=Petrotoga sp. 9PWA.NaAc.5.4 TaxID=1434328 RepID=UPI000CB02834|nr:DeoR/GlpR family DNA-binding transcription regulator [Petrotoga sp. 9PWA.NaAc.5.4]PNR95789.1 DeoR family transcriptional regulator [Petrotoga sp. 9PWA.NaAc.5.4]